MKRPVYLVYEPVSRESAVPYLVQQLVGFSHAKLVILTRGTITGPGAGKVYDIWKDGKIEIGYGDNEQQPFPWPGLKEGELYQQLCITDMDNRQIASKANEVIKDMGNYNLVFSNCEDFAYKLAAEISNMVMRVEYSVTALEPWYPQRPHVFFEPRKKHD